MALILTILVALVSIPLTTCERSAPVVRKPFSTVGQVAGDEVLKLLNNRGKIVVVMASGPPIESQTMTSQVDALNEVVKKQPGITVVATEQIVYEKGPEIIMAGDQYLQILQRHSDVDAIVSFAGFPHMTDEQINSLGQEQKVSQCALILSMGPMMPGLKRLFDNQLIQLAIVPRFQTAALAEKPPTTTWERFDRFFMVITSENASSLAF